MPAAHELEFEDRPGCLSIRVHGRHILEHKADTIRFIADALKARQLSALLLDCRALPGELTFMDRFQLGLQAGRYLAGVRVCVLARPDQADPQKIGQLVARNRGTDVTTVTDPAVAEAWVAALSRPA